MESVSALRKTNRLLQIFFGVFLLIVFRIWHLAVIQREEKLVESQKPQRKTFVQRAARGSIVDRFGIPLAQNRIRYNASIYYSQISQIPSLGWKTDASSKRCRTYPRREYIRNLSRMLAYELSLDEERIADLIHSKASLFPYSPYVIESNLSEKQYYRLKALERDWPGLLAESASERFYPMGKTASHLLGHLGAISRREYHEIAGELDLLRQMILDGNEESSIAIRYEELKEKAYTINDLIGKTGIEKQYEKELRGFCGKKTFEIDRQGKILRQLSGGRDPLCGQTVVLSISAKLQQFCEELLIQNEKTRDNRSLGIDPETKKRTSFKQPWIKGGAIVALDPNTGEVLAMASTPRFDPNDFILTKDPAEKLRRLHRWQEDESFIGDLFDGKEPLYREKGAQEESTFLSWADYLFWTLPQQGPLHAFWNRADDLKTAIHLQEDFEALLYYSGNPKPAVLMEAIFSQTAPSEEVASVQAALRACLNDAQPHKRRVEALLGGIPNNGDKLFALDLCRMAVYSPAFTDELIRKMGSLKIGVYRSLVQSLQTAQDQLCERAAQVFHAREFKDWRRSCFKEYLLQKRAEEQERGAFAKPYLDYLEQKERELFDALWSEIRIPLIAAYLKQDASHLTERATIYFDYSLLGARDWTLLRTAASELTYDECVQWLKTMRSYRELQRPLWGSYSTLRGKKGEQLEKHLAAAFYPIGGFANMRSHALQCAAPLGSIFKLVTSYEALRQKERETRDYSIFDEIRFDASRRSCSVAATKDRKPIPRHYKGGRLPRSARPHIGQIELISALEQSSNPYFSLLAGDLLERPEDLAFAALQLGFGERTGIDIPGEIKGRLPNDLAKNRTGLYSFAIGQHTLVATPLQTACMLSALANGGKLLTPQLTCCLEGRRPKRGLAAASSFLAKQELAYLGIDFPLFFEQQQLEEETKNAPIEAQVRRRLHLPPSIRNALFEGMDRVIWGSKGCARPSAIKELYGKPLLLREFLSLQHQMIGKTSTAEILGRASCNPGCLPSMYKHIWFGAIGFEPSRKGDKSRWERPEIVVAVYLRYGDGGKEAAPLAAQVIHKWREIKREAESYSF